MKRISIEEANKRKDIIDNYVKKHPNQSINEISEELNFPRYFVAYHLDKNFSDRKKRQEYQRSKAPKTKIKTHLERERRKSFLIKLFGDKCCKCGYNKCVQALDFHHVNPDNKYKNISQLMSNLYTPWEEVIEEAEKCILLCRNCHSEEHVKNYKKHLKECEKEIPSNKKNTVSWKTIDEIRVLYEQKKKRIVDIAIFYNLTPAYVESVAKYRIRTVKPKEKTLIKFRDKIIEYEEH